MNMRWKFSCALVVVAAAMSAASAAAQSTAAVPAAAASADPRQEGVKVHGDWTLTVRNPDGTVAARHEFKNALAVHLGANELLTQLLNGSIAVGHWGVELFALPNNACNENNAPCTIFESSAVGLFNSRDLTRTVPASGPDAGKFVLLGSVRLPVNAAIEVVSTALTTCAASAPSPCVSQTRAAVTQKLLTPSVPVVQGQLVEIKVVISFS